MRTNAFIAMKLGFDIVVLRQVLQVALPTALSFILQNFTHKGRDDTACEQ